MRSCNAVHSLSLAIGRASCLDSPQAISEAIKILNDDDALDIFSATKKEGLVQTSKKSALLQQRKHSKVARAQAIFGQALLEGHPGVPAELHPELPVPP